MSAQSLHSQFWEEDEAPAMLRYRIRQRAAYGAAITLGKKLPPPPRRSSPTSNEIPPPPPLTTIPVIKPRNTQAIIREVLRHYGLKPIDVERRGGAWATACVHEMAYRLATYGRSASNETLSLSRIGKLLHRHPSSIRYAIQQRMREDAGA